MRAWLTPEAATGTYACRRLSIPVEMLHIVMGALEPLKYESNYEADGTMTPAQAAALMIEMLNTYETTEGECTMPELGEVFWSAVTTQWNAGIVRCDGAVYANSDYPVYAAMLAAMAAANGGENWWAEDATHFFVPNLQNGRFINAPNEAFDDQTQVGQFGGAQSVTLTINQIPSHNHSYVRSTTAASAVLGNIAGIENDANLNTVTGNAGGGQSHENRPPFQTLMPWIRIA